MNLSTYLLKFVVISNVYVCLCFGKSYQSDHHRHHQFEPIHDNETIKKEIIARLNDTEAVALAEVMQKEPKFFDEFECK